MTSKVSTTYVNRYDDIFISVHHKLSNFFYGYRTMNVRVSQDFIPSRLHTCTSILLFILKQNSLLVLKIKRRKIAFFNM